MNQAFINDIKKGLSKAPLNQEVSPGSVGRRYEPEQGIKKHRERIHKESKYADDHKNLPFKFSRISKPTGKSTYIKCNNCGRITSGSTNTVGIICKDCGKFSSVSVVEYE